MSQGKAGVDRPESGCGPDTEGDQVGEGEADTDLDITEPGREFESEEMELSELDQVDPLENPAKKAKLDEEAVESPTEGEISDEVVSQQPVEVDTVVCMCIS